MSKFLAISLFTRPYLVVRLVAAAFLVGAGAVSAQEPAPATADAQAEAKEIRKIGDQVDGYIHLDRVAAAVKDASPEVRAAAVSTLIKFRSANALAPLMIATRDRVPEIQSLAVDGLVNFYSPEYVRFGWLNSLRTFGGELKGKFSKPEPLVIEPYVQVSPEVVEAIRLVAMAGGSIESRANAARAAGILRGKQALPALQQGVRSRETVIMLEAVRAIEKIQDPSAGPDIVFLLRDLDEDVQFAVIQAVGQLRTREAVPDLVELVKESESRTIRREALIALAKIPDPNQRSFFQHYLADKDKGMRAAAAEGLGRIGNPLDLGVVDRAFAVEKSETPKLSMAFAATTLGNLSRVEYLIQGLDSTVHRLEARPFLVELARKDVVLRKLYAPLAGGTDSQRRHLAYVISMSGQEDSLPHLRRLSEDPDDKIAVAAIEALKVLQARL